MSHWNFWEWLGYAGIWIAGSVIALDTAVKMAPALRIKLAPVLESAWWGFTPLAAIVAGTAILLLDAAGIHLPDLPKTILPYLALLAVLGFSIATFSSLRARRVSLNHIGENLAGQPAKPDAGQSAAQNACTFVKYYWRVAALDPGPDLGGEQGYYRLFLPIRFNRNVKTVTVRVSVLRPTQRLDRSAPQYSWKAIESTDYLEGDAIEVLFATIATNRQHGGYYGEMRQDTAYIAPISRHLFEVDVFYEGGREDTKIYVESPSDGTIGGPPDGLGRMVGIIVLQENDSVFESQWVRESRDAVEGKRSTHDPEPPRGFGFGMGRFNP